MVLGSPFPSESDWHSWSRYASSNSAGADRAALQTQIGTSIMVFYQSVGFNAVLKDEDKCA
jgi:hypothetical protein